MRNEQTGWRHTSDLMARIAQLEAENKLLLDSAHAKSEECNGWVAKVLELRNENAKLKKECSSARLALGYIRDRAESSTATSLHLKEIAKTGIQNSGGVIVLNEVLRYGSNHFVSVTKMVSPTNQD